ncbi:MAG: TatD family nuclease-associated radical SAM protein [Schwartzia sp. (in: firmicutes)]
MILYAVDTGGEYITVEESCRRYPVGKRSVYVNLTNRCPCACTFCLRPLKHMAQDSTLWLKREPTVAEVEAELLALPWPFVKEVVFCGFGEPTMRLSDLATLLGWVKREHPEVVTRLNTNGLSDLIYKRDTSPDFGGGILDIISISLNASNAERYLALTRNRFGIDSYEAMLTFAQHCKEHVPQVVMTVVDQVEDQEEIAACRAICEERGLSLRVRPYESS